MKFNTSLIENFETMTAEEKLAAVLAADLPDTDELEKTNKSYKALIDKYTSEIATLKKGKDAKLSQSEQEAQDLKSQLEDIKAQYNELMRDSAISKYKAKYLALGYSEDLAESTATALATGDMDTVLLNGEKYKADIEKKATSAALRETPRPNGKGEATKTLSKSEIMAIKDPAERQKAIAENINLFTERN